MRTALPVSGSATTPKISSQLLLRVLPGLLSARPAMNANRNLAASAQRRQRRPLGRHGKARRRIVEKRNRRNRCRIVLARLDPQRPLPRRRAKILSAPAVSPHPLGLFQPVQSRRGQQNRIHLPFGQLAQPRIHIAAKLYRLNVRPQRLQLRAPPLAAGAYARALRQRRQACILHRNKRISAGPRAEA